MYPADCKYTKDHEWIKVTGDTGRVGITDYAQKQLGDVVYLDLPEVGRTLKVRRELRHDRIRQGGLGAVQPGRREVVARSTARWRRSPSGSTATRTAAG